MIQKSRTLSDTVGMAMPRDQEQKNRFAAVVGRLCMPGCHARLSCAYKACDFHPPSFSSSALGLGLWGGHQSLTEIRRPDVGGVTSPSPKYAVLTLGQRDIGAAAPIVSWRMMGRHSFPCK